MPHISSPKDVIIDWVPTNAKSVKDALAKWTSLQTQGYALFLDDGTPVPVWDPSLGHVIASPVIPPPEVVALWPTRENIP